MIPAHFKAIIRDIDSHADERPICAFLLRNGLIYTGRWQPLTAACNVLIVTLVNKQAPPIYIDVHAIDAIAVDGIGT